MDFEWDSAKAVANVRKHGISFEEAVSAVRDDLAATARDLAHSVVEFRYITFGTSARGRLLVVSHSERGNRIRISVRV